MKIDRLFSITHILINKKAVTAAELAKQFEVSTRTIYRDVDILSANGIPIYTTQGKGGGIAILDGYTLDKTLLSDEEQNQVLMALQSVKVTGQLKVEESIAKLGNLFQKNTFDWVEIDFLGWEQSEKEKETFQILRDSIMNKMVISFSYFNNKGEKSARLVEPLKLIFKGSHWYLYGYCRKRNDFRFFKLTRIEELVLLNDTFIKMPPPKTSAKDTLSFQKELIKLKLKIDSSMAFRVYDEFRSGTIIKEDDKFLVEVDISNSEWLYYYLLGFGSTMEVIEPIEVRRGLKDEVEKIIKKYS